MTPSGYQSLKGKVLPSGRWFQLDMELACINPSKVRFYKSSPCNASYTFTCINPSKVRFYIMSITGKWKLKYQSLKGKVLHAIKVENDDSLFLYQSLKGKVLLANAKKTLAELEAMYQSLKGKVLLEYGESSQKTYEMYQSLKGKVLRIEHLNSTCQSLFKYQSLKGKVLRYSRCIQSAERA